MSEESMKSVATDVVAEFAKTKEEAVKELWAIYKPICLSCLKTLNVEASEEILEVGFQTGAIALIDRLAMVTFARKQKLQREGGSQT